VASNIVTISPYQPLFMLMANNADWPQDPAVAPPASQDLAQGWNSVCYAGQTKDAETAAAGIEGQYAILYVLTPNEGWKRFVPGRSDATNLTEIQQFTAVFILVSQPEDTRWVFDQ